MPELPDLMAYTGNLRRILSGKEVVEVGLYKPDKANVTIQAMNEALMSARLLEFVADGKEMFITFDNGKTVGVHLMLEGKFHVVAAPEEIAFKTAMLKLEGTCLILSDPKGWAKIALDPEKSHIPDALSSDFSPQYFMAKLTAKRTKNIKAFLIDQGIVRGIGNAYADEILWEAKVSPECKAGKLSDAVAGRLYESVGAVLRRSVDEILQRESHIVNGEIRDFMRVHNSRRKVCPNGFTILRKTIASKTTYYTAEQIVY